MCFVPEFLQLHILNEIDVDWGPKLWKKDQKLACYWEKCEYEVETRQKGARPLQRLKNHMKTHLGIKSYICTFCNGRYTNVTRLDDHFHRQQRGDKFQCDKCKRKFSTERNWNILVPVVLFLLDLSVFGDRCQIYPKNRILRAHLRSHQHIWSCPEEGCLQTLPTFTALSAHMRYSHSDVREFGPCPFCQKKFKSRNDYRYDL